MVTAVDNKKEFFNYKIVSQFAIATVIWGLSLIHI